MKITAIGCLHGYKPKLDGGDLLIVTGDLTARGKPSENDDFQAWLSKQNYKKIILIAGNHDKGLQNDREGFLQHSKSLEWSGDFEYLCDSGTEYEGLKIWGAPWSLWFHGINSDCMAFTGKEKELKKKWDLIPEDTDILITHTPPNGILDAVQDYHSGKIINCGSEGLRNIILDRKRLPNLKLHVFSHIHEWGSKEVYLKQVDFRLINCSIMDEHYKPVYRPTKFEFPYEPSEY